MKLTLQTQLLPTKEQAKLLKETVNNFNKACNWLAEKAFKLQTSNKITLQKEFYYDLRGKFNLSAQMAAICIRHVGGTYSRDKKICPKFREFAAMPYDSRIYSFKGLDKVSLLTLQGRTTVPFIIGKYQADRFTNAKGQADLVYRARDNKWFFLLTVDIPNGTAIPTTDFIGVDLGITNLLTTSDGSMESGNEVKRVARKYSDLRQVLQHKASKQSQNGKRPRNIHKLLKRISKKVRNFKTYSNHCISKKLVKTATDTCKAIALEDLSGIRKRCEKRFRKSQRSLFSGWSFYEIRQFITYKAELAGIPVVLVNPKNTSRECFECGHIAKENRKSQSEFECVNCSHTDNADINASKIIARRASVDNAQSSENSALYCAV